jgi:hypothetical protein
MKIDPAIELKEGVASAPTEVLITEPRPAGWLAFYRSHSISSFSIIYPSDYSTRNYHICPSPLHTSRDTALDEIRKYAKEMGGEARLVMVTL